MTEIPDTADRYGAVVLGGGGGAEEGALLAIEFAAVAMRDVGPLAFGIGGETELVDAGAIVEAIDAEDAVELAEFGGELDVEEGVAVAGAVELEFEAIPTLDSGVAARAVNGRIAEASRVRRVMLCILMQGGLRVRVSRKGREGAKGDAKKDT